MESTGCSGLISNETEVIESHHENVSAVTCLLYHFYAYVTSRMSPHRKAQQHCRTLLRCQNCAKKKFI